MVTPSRVPVPRLHRDERPRRPSYSAFASLCRSEALEQESLGDDRGLEIGQIQRFVRAVSPSIGVFDSGDEDRRVGEDLEQIGDERNRADLLEVFPDTWI